MKRILPMAILAVLLSGRLAAQTDNDQIAFTAIEGLKIFAPHQFYVEGKIWGGELAYHFNLAGDKVHYADFLGIKAIEIAGSYRSLQSLTIDNDPTTKGSLGDTYTLLGRLDIQLARAGPFQLLFIPGFGFAYSTVSYFTNGNPLVGSRLNFAAQAGLKISASLSASTAVQAGFDVFHYSDAAVRVPNNGINSFNLSLGLVQSINRRVLSTPRQPYIYDYKNAFEFGFDVGERGVYHTKGELYRSGLYAGYSYGLNSIFRLKAGFDAGYYFTTYNLSENDATYEGLATSYDRLRVGVSAGAEVNLGRLVVMASYGYYLHFYSYNPVHTYWLPGLKYDVLPWVAIQGKVYVHRTEADYLGIGLIFSVH